MKEDNADLLPVRPRSRGLCVDDAAACSLLHSRSHATLSTGGSVDQLLAGLGAGTSIGAKFVRVLPAAVSDVVSVRLNITLSRGSPSIRELSVFASNGLADGLDAEWSRAGYALPVSSWKPEERYIRPWGRAYY